METWLIPLFGGVGAALLGLLSTLLIQYMNRRKVGAEARSLDADYGVKVTASAVTLINELQDEVTNLRERQKAIENERQQERKEMETLRLEVSVLRSEVEQLRQENSNLKQELARLKPMPKARTVRNTS